MTYRQVTPIGAEPLRHGYTLNDLHHAAVHAVDTAWNRSADHTDRYDAAWHAIAEHLYTTDDPPTRRDLVRSGRNAVDRLIQDEWRHHGVTHHNPYGDAGKQFQRYWWAAHATPSHEDRIVDRVALHQIWPKLGDTHRTALAALAAHGDYSVAAHNLGRTYHTYATGLRRARLAFLKLWHDGETPSRVWGHDRRVGAEHRKPATYAVVRRHRAAARRHEPTEAADA